MKFWKNNLKAQEYELSKEEIAKGFIESKYNDPEMFFNTEQALIAYLNLGLKSIFDMGKFDEVLDFTKLERKRRGREIINQ